MIGENEGVIDGFVDGLPVGCIGASVGSIVGESVSGGSLHIVSLPVSQYHPDEDILQYF